MLDSECRTYLIRCKIYKDACCFGSTKNLISKWANHRLAAKLKIVNKYSVTQHVHTMDHPNDSNLSYLQIFAIEKVSDGTCLRRRETWQKCNLGTILKGLNN